VTLDDRSSGGAGEDTGPGGGLGAPPVTFPIGYDARGDLVARPYHLYGVIKAGLEEALN